MWDTMIGEYPSLEGKSESVAFITWVLKSNRDIEPAALRDVGKKAGIPVAGRAIGSARETLGITKPKAKKAAKKGGAKKTGGRKPRATSSGISGMADVMSALETLKGMERQNQQMRNALEKIQDVIGKALDA